MKERLVWSSPSTDDAIRVLSAEGYDGVEWMLGHHFRTRVELQDLARATRSRGLEISNIMCWQDLVTPNADSRNNRVSNLENFISAAGELSIPVVNVFTGPMTWLADHATIGREISEAAAWKVVIEAFSKIVEAAERNDITITVEAVFGMLVHDYYTMRELLDQFESKNLAVNLDPSHLVLYGNDPSFALERLGCRVKHVHLKDAVGKPGSLGEHFVFPFLGEGSVDWSSFFKSLRSIGYTGYLSLEFENDTYLNNVCDGDWGIAARESKRRLLHLLKKSGLQ